MTSARFHNVTRIIYAYRASLFVYFCIGVISALVNWISFYISFIHLHSHYAFSAIIAFIIATAVNYFLSAKVGFLSNGRTRIRQFLGVYLVSMLGLCVDLLVLVFLYDYLEINVMTSKIAGTSAAFFVNFAGRQAFVFLRQPRWSSLSAIPRELSGMASRGKPNSSAHRSRT